MTMTEELTLIMWMRDMRTLSQDEVDARSAEHDVDDLQPEERLSIDTETMHKVIT